MMGLLLIPIIMLLFAGLMLVSVFSSAFNLVTTGGEITYNENVFQDYADSQYAAEFGSTKDYEDNLLIVITVEDDEYYDYQFIAWCGDHIAPKINNMFGSNSSKLGVAIQNSAINSKSYKYSLDSGIASVVDTMREHVEGLELDSSFTCKTERVEYNSHLTNKTSLDVTEETVNNALVQFTESTGIPIVVVVEDIEDVFPKTVSDFDVFSLVIAVVFIVIAVVLIVNAVKKRGEGHVGGGNNGNP